MLKMKKCGEGGGKGGSTDRFERARKERRGAKLIWLRGFLFLWTFFAGTGCGASGERWMDRWRRFLDPGLDYGRDVAEDAWFHLSVANQNRSAPWTAEMGMNYYIDRIAGIASQPCYNRPSIADLLYFGFLSNTFFPIRETRTRNELQKFHVVKTKPGFLACYVVISRDYGYKRVFSPARK